MTKQITLSKAIQIMEGVNKLEDWCSFFENGHLIIQSKLIIIGENDTMEVENGN